MRLHPISLALRYLKGQRTLRGAPYYGRPLFDSREEAAARLRQFTGQDFGTDATAWGEWLRRNRWVCYADVQDRQDKMDAGRPGLVNRPRRVASESKARQSRQRGWFGRGFVAD